jgi:hypothetical protein
LPSNDSEVNYDRIRYCYIGLKNSSFIKEFDENNVYETTLESAEQSILSYIKGLIMNLTELKFDLGHP